MCLQLIHCAMSSDEEKYFTSLFVLPSRILLCSELLEEHFTRHSKGGSRTKVIVFTQLRATVREIVADLGDTPGYWNLSSHIFYMISLGAICSHLIYSNLFLYFFISYGLTLSYLLLSDLIYYYLIWAHLILSHVNLSHDILSCLSSSHLISSHLVLIYLIYYYLFWYDLISSYLIISELWLLWSRLFSSTLILPDLIWSILIWFDLIWSYFIVSDMIPSHLIS